MLPERLSENLGIAESLFRETPSIASLNSSGIEIGEQETIAVRVWQNHSPALFLKFSKTYARFAGFHLNFLDEGYDDSFSWFGLREFDDIVGSHLIWLDVDRFSGSNSDPKQWFIERVSELRETSSKEISCFISSVDEQVAELWREAVGENIPGIFVTSTWSGLDASGEGVIDERMIKIGGTYLSAGCQARLARDLSIRRFVTPATAPTKLIIVDLDWTMYDGVLVEDGVQGVELTKEHERLWNTLKEARDAGVLLGIASKNETKFVREFFEVNREAISLGIDDFVGTEIHFGPKSESVESLIALARTTPRATVFIDDNVGELAEVVSRFPDINLVVGGLESTTRHWLRSGIPGIKWGTRDDNVEARVADIKARRARDGFAKHEALNNSLESSSFLREMGISLHVKADDNLDLPRISDMISRTNQFNTNLNRKTEDELLKIAAKSDTHWVTVGLRDKFVDSGVIFAIVVEPNEYGKFSASNFVMSCRAMGRGLEPLIVRESISALEASTQGSDIFVPWIAGPRNRPALEFLKENSVGFSLDDDQGVCTLSESTLLVPHQFDEFIKVTRERFTK